MKKLVLALLILLLPVQSWAFTLYFNNDKTVPDCYDFKIIGTDPATAEFQTVDVGGKTKNYPVKEINFIKTLVSMNEDLVSVIDNQKKYIKSLEARIKNSTIEMGEPQNGQGLLIPAQPAEWQMYQGKKTRLINKGRPGYYRGADGKLYIDPSTIPDSYTADDILSLSPFFELQDSKSGPSPNDNEAQKDQDARMRRIETEQMLLDNNQHEQQLKQQQMEMEQRQRDIQQQQR